MTAEGFRSYFFNSTTIVAVVIDRDTVEKGVKPASISEAIAGRSVEDAIGGCYYVYVPSVRLTRLTADQAESPTTRAAQAMYVQRCSLSNVPAPSMPAVSAPLKLTAQLCNAGFLVPPAQRGKKIGSALAKSFLEYGPRLGYRGSVFNLVYKSESMITTVLPWRPGWLG